MSYKMDGDSIAPEVFTFAGPAVPLRKTRPLRNQKNKNNTPEEPVTARPSQTTQNPQSSQKLPVSPISPPGTDADFWEKPPAFCDISIKDALAPIKRNGVEIESPFTTDQVLRAAAAEIEQYNGEGIGEGKGMENYGWYLGKEEVDKKRKAAERAKYAGKAKGKGKVQGKLVNLSQLRAVAAGLARSATAGPSVVAPSSNNNGKPVHGYIARPSQKFVPIDSGSDTGSEYHDADCNCGCVSASDIEEEEQAARMADAAVQISGKRPRTTCSDSDSYIPKPSYKGKEVARGAPSETSTIPSMRPPPRESEDEYYGSDCGCEGEYCDSDCDFYPSDFYASDVYFDDERPATPDRQTPAAALSVASSSPISYASTPSRSSSSDVEDDILRVIGRAQRRATRSIPHPEVEENIRVSGASKAGRRAAAKEKALRQQGEGSKHSPPAKRRRSTTSSSPPRGHRTVDTNVVTLGQLALMSESRNAPNSFDRIPLPTRRQMEPEIQESDADRLRRERMLEMERQRQFLQTLVADLPRMQQETAAIVAASFTSAPPNPYLPSPPDTPTPPFPGSTYADGNVLVVRRPSVPSDFEFEEEEVSEYDSETDPWTFIQQATARDIVRVERAGAEPSIDMLVRLQKSSRREAFGLWRDKLRSRQAARASAPPQRTSLPSRPRTGPRANSASLTSVQEQGTLPLRRRLEATGTPQERAKAMKLQLEAVLGPPSQTHRASGPSTPSSAPVSAQSKISSAISLSLQVEAELRAAAQQPTSKHTLEALASRHSKALSRMKESYESQSREIEERAFAEVRELALAARASGSFRPLTRNPVPQRGGERGMMDGFIGTRDAARNWTPVRREGDGLRGGRDVRQQVSSLEARAFAEVRELALDRRAREAEHATRSLRPYLHTAGSWNVLDANFAPPAQWPANHSDSAPFPTITPEGPQYLGYRTPEYLWRTGWEGWTNLTPEQQDEEAIRIRGMGRHSGKECALKRHLSSRDVNCRTAFVCLLCRRAHLASF